MTNSVIPRPNGKFFMVSHVPNIHLGIYKNYQNFHPLIFLRVYAFARGRGWSGEIGLKWTINGLAIFLLGQKYVIFGRFFWGGVPRPPPFADFFWQRNFGGFVGYSPSFMEKIAKYYMKGSINRKAPTNTNHTKNQKRDELFGVMTKFRRQVMLCCFPWCNCICFHCYCAVWGCFQRNKVRVTNNSSPFICATKLLSAKKIKTKTKYMNTKQAKHKKKKKQNKVTSESCVFANG